MFPVQGSGDSCQVLRAGVWDATLRCPSGIVWLPRCVAGGAQCMWCWAAASGSLTSGPMASVLMTISLSPVAASEDRW